MLEQLRPVRLVSPSGLSVSLNRNGSLRRFDGGEITLNLFMGNELDGGPANLWLRDLGARRQLIPLLGPRSSTQWKQPAPNVLSGAGEAQGLRYSIALVLAEQSPAWFWHVSVASARGRRELDLVFTQDVALAPYAAIRLNEYYVSQYIDHTPLEHPRQGLVVASRQNQPVSGRHPWCVIGSLREGVSFATDAVQVYGRAARAGDVPVGLEEGLPGRRLQHEHSMVAVQDAPVRLEPGKPAALGFFGVLVADHGAATSASDLRTVDEALAAPEAAPIFASFGPSGSLASQPVGRDSASLFSHAPLLTADDLHEPDFVACFGAVRRHEERDEHDRLLSFFCADDRHVVLRAKELRVQRPHGHLLRTGLAPTPDEAALASTTWMAGVFHSMLTQGHVSINRFLSTTHSYLGLFRSHGLRVFAEIGGEWRLLDTPSAYEMAPTACRWIYRHAQGVIDVMSEAHHEPHVLTLRVHVRSGPPMRFLISQHVALNGDDGALDGAARWRVEGGAVAVYAAEGSDVHRRFPNGSFLMSPEGGTVLEHVGGDELLFLDGRSREQPYLCIVSAPSHRVELRIEGRLVPNVRGAEREGEIASGYSLQPAAYRLAFAAPAASPLACAVRQLCDITPWFIHNALVHYLSPRGLEQYSGGGWGTRDVCQGPVEMLLALGDVAPIRDLLRRVFRAQNADGDWPQWFMFFERERAIRAGDSHGDIVFWPLLALAQYVIVSADASILEESEDFHAADGVSGPGATLWEHAQRALAVIERRVIAGTALAAYGQGDWNDSLQPADPAMRRQMCSAWTVTLHHQTLTTLARALRIAGRIEAAAHCDTRAAEVRRDFQRLLLVDGVLAGYALFEESGVRYLLHPRDDVSGVRFSALAMIHAILEDLFTPEQMREHLTVIEAHLSGPDGVRLFDRPMPYRGGAQRFFQRAETATFFGREIGLMYMHAHLRYAQALAHAGEAERFFHALRQANPIGLRELAPPASLRQSNCYYSSSDAAFADRYEASAHYERVRRGEVALDGGWRVYSSGAGIATSLIVRRLLGVAQEHDALVVDPVMPPALSGLIAGLTLYGRAVEISYDVRAPGYGVTSVEMNGARQNLTYEQNPYRKGAARVSKAELLAAMRSQRNVMLVALGER